MLADSRFDRTRRVAGCNGERATQHRFWIEMPASNHRIYRICERHWTPFGPRTDQRFEHGWVAPAKRHSICALPLRNLRRRGTAATQARSNNAYGSNNR
ncbi:hypothetical protein XAR_1100 [Xanthomonas citri pv. glycines str. 8ra]|nr:hypothetical protein XAR_1100 [Xanthomonas citri pv. glycines str. 8ra]